MGEIDSTDRNIVNLLMQDGRLSATEIARKLDQISERAVRYRIDKLIREKAIRICAIPDPKVLGFSVTADVWLVVEADSILDVARKLAEFDCVSYVACSIGETDVSIQIVGKSTDEIFQFVTKVIGKVPGVRKTTISIVPIVLKDVYQWKIPERSCLSKDEHT